MHTVGVSVPLPLPLTLTDCVPEMLPEAVKEEEAHAEALMLGLWLEEEHAEEDGLGE